MCIHNFLQDLSACCELCITSLHAGPQMIQFGGKGSRKCLHVELILGLGLGLAQVEEEENSRYKAFPICERRQGCPQVWVTGVGRQRELKDEAGKAAWGHIVSGVLSSVKEDLRPSLWGPGETLNTVLG